LSTAEAKGYRDILDLLADPKVGGQQGQEYLTLLRRIESLERPQQYISRPLLSDERETASFRRTGPLRKELSPAEEDELSRARMIDDVIIIPPPKPKPGPQPAAAPDEAGGFPGEPVPVVVMPPRPAERPGPQPESQPSGQAAVGDYGEPLPAPERPQPKPGPRPDLARGRADADLEALRAEAEKLAQAMDPEIEAHRRRDAQVRASAMGERELQRAWRETRKILDEQQRDIERSESKYKELATWRHAGIGLSAREEDALYDGLPGKIIDGRAEIKKIEVERAAIGAAAAAKGLVENESGQLAPPPPPPPTAAGGDDGGRMAAMAAMGGRVLTGVGAAVAAKAVYEAWQFANRAATTFEETQRRVFDTGMRLGGGFVAIRRQYVEDLEGPLKVDLAEQMQARLAMAMTSGQTDAGGAMEFARAYGLDVGSTAGVFGRIGTLGAMPMSRPVESAVPAIETAPRARDSVVTDSRGASGSWGDPPAVQRPPQRSGPMTNADAAAMADDLMARVGGWLGQSRDVVGGWRTRVGLVDGAWEKARDFAEQYGAGVAHTRGNRFDARGAPTIPPPRSAPVPEQPQRRTGRGMEHILASAYTAAGLSANGDAGNAMMTAFLEQAGRLMEQQTAAGGAPLGNFETGPAMLARAVTAFDGSGLTPGAQLRFGSQMVGGMVQGLQQPKDAVRRGIQMRAIMRLGNEMSPEELKDFREQTEPLAPGGGLDPTTLTGATAVMQNMTSLPGDLRTKVMEAVLGGLTQVTGGGEMRVMSMAEGFFGGQMAPAITLNKILEDLARADLPKEERVDQEKRFLALMDQAGSEKNPWVLDRQAEKAEATAGVFRQIGQSVEGGIYDLATAVERAWDTWDSRVTPIARDGQ
jgi:hypothetical protein